MDLSFGHTEFLNGPSQFHWKLIPLTRDSKYFKSHSFRIAWFNNGSNFLGYIIQVYLINKERDEPEIWEQRLHIRSEFIRMLSRQLPEIDSEDLNSTESNGAAAEMAASIINNLVQLVKAPETSELDDTTSTIKINWSLKKRIGLLKFRWSFELERLDSRSSARLLQHSVISPLLNLWPLASTLGVSEGSVEAWKLITECDAWRDYFEARLMVAPEEPVVDPVIEVIESTQELLPTLSFIENELPVDDAPIQAPVAEVETAEQKRRREIKELTSKGPAVVKKKKKLV